MFNNKFKLNLNVFTNLCHSQYSKRSPVARKHRDVYTPLVNGILNNAVIQSSPHINQNAASDHSHPAHFSGRLVAEYDPDFVVNCIEVRAVRRPQIWKFREVTTISKIIAFSE